MRVAITGSGFFAPSEALSNEELVASFNQYVARYNREHAAEIQAGEYEALLPSSEAFIEKASGIRSRYVVNKSGILNPEVMHPILQARSDEELSLQAEMGVKAARNACQAALIDPKQLEACIVGCSSLERAYPAIAIEIQQALGMEGFAYDMNVACSSATFAIQAAYNMIVAGQATRVLVVSPEICSGHLEWRDRDCHFIFGDVATAVILESEHMLSNARVQHEGVFFIHSLFARTVFSNNIRNNFGFLNRCERDPAASAPEAQTLPTAQRDKTFYQNGRKVFKDVVPWVSDLILAHLEAKKIATDQIRRLWLHQANINMNQLICKKVMGREPTEALAPVILDEFANTSSAGSILAFHQYQQGFKDRDLGLLCSFGAGYSVGCLVLEYAVL